jgi:hypothetical protein
MAINQQPIADLSKWAPPQRRHVVDGDVVIEKLSPLPGPRMLDPDGNVIEKLPMSNGIANRAMNDPYRVTLLPLKLQEGWIHMDRCPLGVNESVPHLPPSVRFQAGPDGKLDLKRPKGPCMAGANGAKLTADNPCACIGALEKHRKAKHAKKEAASEERTNKLAKLAERTAQANLDATTQLAAAASALADAAKGNSGGKRDPKGEPK